MERNDIFIPSKNSGGKITENWGPASSESQSKPQKDSICFVYLLSNGPTFKLCNDALYNEIILLPVFSQNASLRYRNRGRRKTLAEGFYLLWLLLLLFFLILLDKFITFFHIVRDAGIQMMTKIPRCFEMSCGQS